MAAAFWVLPVTYRTLNCPCLTFTALNVVGVGRICLGCLGFGGEPCRVAFATETAVVASAPFVARGLVHADSMSGLAVIRTP